MTDKWTSDCGTVTLYCGDCLEILPTLAPGSVDAVVTDPPYGTGKLTTAEDGKIYHEYFVWDDWKNIPEIGRCQLVFIPPEKKDNYKRLLVAVKTLTVCVRNVSPRYGVQLIGCSGTPPPTYALDWAQYVPVQNGVHPCEKPVELLEWLVSVASFNGETIADPFMGSGTTGVACVRLGRRFVGIELEPKYYAIAKRRIQDELNRVKFLEPKQRETQRTLLEVET